MPTPTPTASAEPKATAPKPTAPKPTAAPKATAPKPTAAPKATAPKPTAAPKATAPKPTAAPKATAPKPTAAPKATAPKPTTAPKATAPKPTAAPKATVPVETTAPAPEATAPEPVPTVTSQAAVAEPSITYNVHVQDEGWHDRDTDGGVAGSSSLSKRLEAIKIMLAGAPAGSRLTYRTAVRTKGWTGTAANGQVSGTAGRGLPIEAIVIGLEGPIAQTHDVLYRMRITELGWMSWVRDGGRAGTTMSGMQASAIQIMLVPKGAAAPPITGDHHPRGYAEPVIHYVSHVQGVGWQRAVVNGTTSGDPNRRARVEAVRASLTGAPVSGNVEVAAHVQRVGWQGWKPADTTAGTTGKALRIEALKFKLTGSMANRFNVYYRAYVQGFGWLGWTSNGKSAGSEGMGLRLVAYQVRVLPKSAAAPGGGAAFVPKPRYQTPGGYAKISYAGQPAARGVGFPLTEGREGAKVKAIANNFGIARPTQWVDATFMSKVRGWQKSRGLPQTGVVDKRTWTSMGFSSSSWTALDGYVAPLKAKPNMTRSQLISAMIATAKSYQGSPYVWGGSNSPGVGADCVGVVMQALLAVGLNVEPSNTVTHTTPGNTTPREIYASKKFKHVPYSQRQPGDLIFQAHDPRDPHSVRHVQMYLGNGLVMESVHVGGIVRAENTTYPASKNMPTVIRPLP
ncbi:NlpC/P60 family protein [Microbacterium rhizophilus]|uniref:NlpC/P60 family protein n=1 Tax=Microbacterium rhizophilus TaxID=3138934 RepID=UPI0031E96F19